MIWSFKKTTKKDIEEICKVAVQKSLRGQYDHILKWVQINADEGPAYAGYYREELVVVGGIRLRGELGQVWAIFSPAIEHCKKTALTEIRDQINFLISVHKIRKLLATCQPGFGEAKTLIKHLGFREAAETFQGETVFIRD